MKAEQQGTITHIGEAQTFASGFVKKTVVIEYKSGDYTNLLAADMLKDKTALLDQAQIGDVVTLTCDVRSREYGGKYYTDVVCLRMATDAKVGQAPEQAGAANDDMMDVDEGLNF